MLNGGLPDHDFVVELEQAGENMRRWPPRPTQGCRVIRRESVLATHLGNLQAEGWRLTA